MAGKALPFGSYSIGAAVTLALAQADQQIERDYEIDLNAAGVGRPLGIMLAAAPDRNAESPHPSEPESRQVRRARERAQRK